MPYAEVVDFRGGLDRRRPAAVGEPGRLYIGKNVHLTRGGDIESVKKFVPVYSLPAGTFGVHALKGKLYVFGSAAAPSGLPGAVRYQRLQHPSGAAMIALLSVENFNGKIYAIARYDDWSVYHFYDGARITDWETLADGIANTSEVARVLAEEIDTYDAYSASAEGAVVTVVAAEPGTAYASTTAVGGTAGLTKAVVQANVAAVAETQATGGFTVTGGAAAASNYIDSITVNGVELLSASVYWVLSHTATAAALAAAINDGPTAYTATSAGADVTITAPAGTGATPNGYVVAVSVNGILTVGSVVNMASGVAAVEPVAQVETFTVGTFLAANMWEITLDGTAFGSTGRAAGMGRLAFPFRSKVYSPVGSLLHFCAVDTPTSWTSGTGYGFENIANQNVGAESVSAIGNYQGALAVFARESAQIWTVDADPANNVLVKPLRNTGTRAAASVADYGSNDLFYLADTGVRSLQARDVSDAAFVHDVGIAVDDYVEEHVATLTTRQVIAGQSVIEPKSSRYWLALGGVIFVFSYFPGSKISAWSTYEPGFTVETFTISGGIVFARAADTIYAYGGLSGDTYPGAGEVESHVRLPYLDFNKPADWKTLMGVDISSEAGVWALKVLMLKPDNTAAETAELVLSGTTFSDHGIPLEGQATHFAPDLVSSAAGRKSLSSVVLHFREDESQ